MTLDAARPYLYAAVAVALFGAGAAVNGWRLGTAVETLKRQHAEAVGAAATAAGKQLAEAVATRDALALRLSGIDAAGTEELQKVKNENDSLRRRVSSGTIGLRVAATCPAVNSPAASTAKSGRLDSGAAAVLNPAAEQDYFALRENIVEGESKLATCQQSLKEYVNDSRFTFSPGRLD